MKKVKLTKSFGTSLSKNKFKKYTYLHKEINNLTKANNYSRCFSHMSAISIFVTSRLLKKNKIKSTLWFTHPGPSFGLKKFILFSAYKFSDNIVTASKTSFPFISNCTSPNSLFSDNHPYLRDLCIYFK